MELILTLPFIGLVLLVTGIGGKIRFRRLRSVVIVLLACYSGAVLAQLVWHWYWQRDLRNYAIEWLYAWGIIGIWTIPALIGLVFALIRKELRWAALAGLLTSMLCGTILAMLRLCT